TFLGGFGKLENRIRRYVPDPDLRRLYTFQALYAGLPPSKALAIYGAIPHMDTALGVHFPRGGMRQIAEVMSKAFVDAGGQLFTGTEVTEIEFTKSRATAVQTTGGRIECDALVVTTDLGELETLIPRRRRFPRRLQASPSCVVIHGSIPVAIAQQMPMQAHHTIEFGAEWSRTFEEITAPDGLGRLMTDPSLLLTRPALTDPSMRFMRHGQLQEPLSILAPCPNLDSAPLDWDALTESYVQDLLATLESRGYPWLRSEFRIDRVDTPATWKAAGMLAGSPFSAAHLFRQTGPFRTRNLLRRTDNIVLAGCGTTPGVGVPTVLLSGKLAAQRMGAETSR
ncbi:MAG: phytoene desaturase, partial [Nocardiaceae bacterium]|nr:phytoene desaturase [Nocardiaceae bacterium]